MKLLIIHKRAKKYYLLILSFIIAMSCLQLFFTFAFPKTITNDIVQYESSLEPKAEYQVMILPNEVYSGTKQEEGLYYSKKLLNYIQANFGFQYEGSNQVPIDVQYQIVATVCGYQGKDTNKEVYWEKEFPLTGEKAFTEKSGSCKKDETASFSLSGYDAFAVKAKEITGMKVANEVVISMTGKVTAHTPDQDSETPIDISITIPLLEDVFRIEKGSLDPVRNQITDSVETAVSADKAKILLYGILLFICIGGLTILLFFSREPDSNEIMRKKVNTTLKNYGSRIVALHSLPKTIFRQQYETHSIKDLIKIADDMQKPIVYETDAEQIVKHYQFCIIDDDTLYSYRVDRQE